MLPTESYRRTYNAHPYQKRITQWQNRLSQTEPQWIQLWEPCKLIADSTHFSNSWLPGCNRPVHTPSNFCSTCATLHTASSTRFLSYGSECCFLMLIISLTILECIQLHAWGANHASELYKTGMHRMLRFPDDLVRKRCQLLTWPSQNNASVLLTCFRFMHYITFLPLLNTSMH